MNDPFDLSFDRLMGNEGGYVNHPADPGGETNWGITWPVLNRAIGQGIMPPHSTIAKLTREDAKEIYEAFFWDEARMDDLDPAVAFQVFDAAVNHGIETAVRMLQRAVGVADDGHIGPVTLDAVKGKSPSDVIALFTAERLDFWRKLSTWPTFGKGWAGRAADNLRYAAHDT